MNNIDKCCKCKNLFQIDFKQKLAHVKLELPDGFLAFNGKLCPKCSNKLYLFLNEEI